MFTAVTAVISVALQLVVKSHVPYLVYSIVVFVPTLAVMVRRLHDGARSAWWLLIGAVPVVGAIVLLVFLASGGNEGSDPKDAGR